MKETHRNSNFAIAEFSFCFFFFFLDKYLCVHLVRDVCLIENWIKKLLSQFISVAFGTSSNILNGCLPAYGGQGAYRLRTELQR